MEPGMGLSIRLSMGLEVKAPWDTSPWDEMIDPLREAIEGIEEAVEQCAP
jgi:hypothetical protein